MADKGRSEKNIFGGGYTHYDSNGKKIGRSEPNIFGGGYTNYDANGKKVGRTEQNFFGGGYTTYDNKGNKVGRTEHQVFDRAFIRTYYVASPTIVKIFRNTNWFKAMWKKPLDKMVSGVKIRAIRSSDM